MGIGGTKEISARTVQVFAQKKQAKSKLFCGGGLFLNITDAGSAKWRIKYRHDNKEKTYTLGDYPEISLAAARIELGEVKAQLKHGKNPVVERHVTKASNLLAVGNTFKAVANMWLEKKEKEWSHVHYTKSARALERDIYPIIGHLPISEITPAILSSTLEKISRRGVTETARRILQHVAGVFRYSEALGLSHNNPTISAREVLPKTKVKENFAALLNFEELGNLLKQAELANVSRSIYRAHRLIAYTGMRITNIVEAKWKEFDLDAAQPVWVIPRPQMKVKSRKIDHRIPLPETIANELRKWRSTTNSTRYLFPSPQNPEKHIGREGLEKFYRVTLRLKNTHTPHGWRSALTSTSKDSGLFAKDVVLIALDHLHADEVELAYDRGERWEQRVKLFAWWGEQLDAAWAGGGKRG